VETGWPKLDPLFRGGEGGSPWRLGWPAERPLVLYASTFTPSLSSAPHLVQPIRELASGGRWNWLVTLHPKMAADVVRAYRALEGPHLRFVETDDVIPLLRAADVMVSDTSSIVFEFLLQHRPAVTFRNARPGPHLVDVREPGQLGAALERALERPPQLLREIARFGESIHPHRDGHSSERVLEAVEDFLEHRRAGLRPRPWNLWRRLALRRRLGYYRWR
jgi:CDP-glycerol glycerophosphotransferase (TagB/SpsB family)